jgi:hypothetical protein
LRAMAAPGTRRKHLYKRQLTLGSLWLSGRF